jgi:hypothetical protein
MLEAFARQSVAPQSLWGAVYEMTAFTRGVLGEERIAWLGALPLVVIHPPVAVVPRQARRCPALASCRCN